jgi:hypothetical protein
MQLLASIDKQGGNFTGACPKMKFHHGTGRKERELKRTKGKGAAKPKIFKEDQT